MITSNKLSQIEGEKLVRVLYEHKEAVGRMIANIKGILPSTCMHRILLEEENKPNRQMQRHLKPLIMNVVKREVLKLLDVGFIYPISKSKWVSLVQLVPKKMGITVIKNQEGEKFSTRVQNGCRVCIDYYKLNASIRKDHFPLHFIDQILERLLGEHIIVV